MGKSQELLLHEAFAYHIAVRFRCGATTQEFEDKLAEAHVDALLYFAHQIQCKLEARPPAGRMQ